MTLFNKIKKLYSFNVSEKENKRLSSDIYSSFIEELTEYNDYTEEEKENTLISLAKRWGCNSNNIKEVRIFLRDCIKNKKI